MKCRSCGSINTSDFLSLGTQPPANSFLNSKEPDHELCYPLDLVFCRNCTLVQLSEDSYVQRDLLFQYYTYASSIAGGLRTHFEKLAKDISNNISKGGLVVDIGSNDGILLKPLRDLGIKAIGVEPAVNMAKIANEQGLETIHGFLNESIVKRIISKYGFANVITAANVFAHLEDVHGFIENVKALLNEHGIFIIEVQYFADMLKEMTFDNIYHEHVLYYCLKSISSLLDRHGMVIFKVEHISTHGGSIRVYVSKDKRVVEDSVYEIRKLEENMLLDNIETYQSFANQLMVRIAEIRSFILDLKEKRKYVVGYGAPAKSSTIINSIGLDNSMIQYIVEDSPLKQGLFTPGSHIPIVDPSMLDKNLPDFIIIFAWNYSIDIMKKLEKYKAKGVRFIIPMPKLKLI